MLKPVRDLFVCSCNFLGHQLIVEGDHWDGADPFVVLSVHLAQAPLRYRIKYAIRYILGLDHKNLAAFDEIMLEPDQVRDLIKSLEKHLENKHDHASSTGSDK